MEFEATDYPITGLCVVSEPTKCPPGYEVIFRSHDKGDDCDLWKDSFFRSRITRYLCFTRNFSQDENTQCKVLVDIHISMDRDPQPDGFTLIDFTVDSREKATRKKQLYMKLVDRSDTNSSVSEIIFLSRTKRAPLGYTLIGEINGLLLCYKISEIPKETEISTAPTQVQDSICNGNTNSQSQNFFSSSNHGDLRRLDSITLPYSVLAGVTFQLNLGLTEVLNLKKDYIPDLPYRSLNDINNEYTYLFATERSVSATPLHQC